MKTHMRGGSQFHLNAFISKFYCVVAGCGLLISVREVGSGTEAVGSENQGLGCGTQQYIAQIEAARTTQVGVGEAFQGTVVVVVAGAGIPVASAGIGTQLYGTKGYRRTRVGVAMESSTYKGIHIVDGGFLLCATSCAQEQSRKNRRKRFHFH